MTIFDMVKDDPKFKRFCARQSTRPVAQPKRFKVPVPKRLGMLSVLGEYTTGRRVKLHTLACGGGQPCSCSGPELDELATLKRVNGELVSQITSYDLGECIVETIPQGTQDAFYHRDDLIERQIALLEEQNRLLRQLAAA